jgi:hypothetical protein
MKKRKKGKIKNKSRASKKEKTMYVFEYYHQVWYRLHSEFHDLLHKRNITEPLEKRRSLILQKSSILDGVDEHEKYEALFSVLMKLEEVMQEVVSSRSVLYWIHIYRRIAPVLAAEIGARTDFVTALETRAFAEQAIFKYGGLDNTGDIGLSSEIEFERILGGLLNEFIVQHLGADEVTEFKNKISSPAQWVLVNFSVDDLASAYFIEGLAYQYWYVCTRMRSLGKGVKIIRTLHGDLDELRTSEQQSLIASYDDRCIKTHLGHGFSSNVGTFVRSEKKDIDNYILFAALNTARHNAKAIGLKNVNHDFSPNYLPAGFDANAYFSAHAYLAEHFEKKVGFGLLEFCQVARLCANVLISSVHDISANAEEPSLVFISKFQRGYIFHGKSLDELKQSIRNMLEAERSGKRIAQSSAEEQLDKILDFLTLNSEKQSAISLWSLGPRFSIISYGEYFFYDYSSWHTIFRNLFFGLRNYDPDSKKGAEFEISFGSITKSMSFDVVAQSKRLRASGLEREIDVGIRIGSNLYVFECRASERPLDFIIGKPKTITARNKDMNAKIDQVDSLVEFLSVNRKGENYDFSWAKNIWGTVVSPYTEWIWSLNEKLWVDTGKYPKVMSVPEALEYLGDASKSLYK